MSLPLNTKEIRETVEVIVKIKNTNHMKKIKQKSYDEYLKEMEKIFPEFKKNVPSIYNVIVDNKDENSHEILFEMLDTKDKIDNGANKDELEKKLGEKLAKKYVYPVTDNLKKT